MIEFIYLGSLNVKNKKTGIVIIKPVTSDGRKLQGPSIMNAFMGK
jgi:hypothetical protein